jgi:hypothetical protein
VQNFEKLFDSRQRRFRDISFSSNLTLEVVALLEVGESGKGNPQVAQAE